MDRNCCAAGCACPAGHQNCRAAHSPGCLKQGCWLFHHSQGWALFYFQSFCKKLCKNSGSADDITVVVLGTMELRGRRPQAHLLSEFYPDRWIPSAEMPPCTTAVTMSMIQSLSTIMNHQSGSLLSYCTVNTYHIYLVSQSDGKSRVIQLMGFVQKLWSFYQFSMLSRGCMSNRQFARL